MMIGSRVEARSVRHLEPVGSGQHQVEHDQIRAQRRGRVERREPVVHLDGLVAGVPQVERDRRRCPGIVFDDQDPRFHACITVAHPAACRHSRDLHNPGLSFGQPYTPRGGFIEE
jgi:hypothetical protein